AVLFAGWLLIGLLRDLANRVRKSASVSAGLRRQPPSYWGMFMAHVGFAATIIGVVLTSQYNIEHDLKMSPGDSDTLAGYEFRFIDVREIQGSNFIADEARFVVYRDGKEVVRLAPQKRRYLASGSVMTEADIDAGVFRDLFVAMGEPVGSAGAWAIRLHYKPFVRWMWAGALLMSIGGFVTVADKRYRRQRSAARESLREGGLRGAQA
ncbi:MAG: heme lyase NrfEFG subunit NrfE, partial [Haliea sp.]|nr:heme lyase NrfEFG subunit NrfE [Haliea sp.]